MQGIPPHLTKTHRNSIAIALVAVVLFFLALSISYQGPSVSSDKSDISSRTGSISQDQASQSREMLRRMLRYEAASRAQTRDYGDLRRGLYIEAKFRREAMAQERARLARIAEIVRITRQKRADDLRKRNETPPKTPDATPVPDSTSSPANVSQAGAGDAGSPFWRLADCESGDVDVPGSANWDSNTGNGYYGGLQFSIESWRDVGGSGYPHENSPEEQIARAEILLSRYGWASGWPRCSEILGYR